MSKPLTLSKKIKLFFLYLKQQQDGVIVNCAFCKSTNIVFDNQLEHLIDDRKVYTSKYTCKSCGSQCKNKQEWFSA